MDMIEIDNLQLVNHEENCIVANRIVATFTVADKPHYNTIYIQKQLANDKYNISINDSLPIFHVEIEQKEVMQIVAQAIIRVYRFRFSKYVFFNQEAVRKNTPQFQLQLHTKPKTKTAQKFIEWLKKEFASGEMIGIGDLEMIEKCIELYSAMEYGKVSPPYCQTIKNYQFYWVNVKVPEGEKGYADWAVHSLHIFENKQTCVNSGGVIATIVPIIDQYQLFKCKQSKTTPQ